MFTSELIVTCVHILSRPLEKEPYLTQKVSTRQISALVNCLRVGFVRDDAFMFQSDGDSSDCVIALKISVTTGARRCA